MKIISYIKSGNSFPIILESNNVRHLVKLRSGISGQYGIVSEWLGNKIGNFLGLNTQLPHWINIPKEINMDDIYQEVKDLIGKSIGINIGFNYLDDLKILQSNELKNIEKQQSTNTFLLDLIMLNIDRNSQNTNIITSGDNLIPIDYESSMWIEELLHNKNLRNNPIILQKLRNSPLFQKIDEEDKIEFLDKLKNAPIKSLLEEIPDSLFDEDRKIIFEKAFEKMNGHNWNLDSTLKELNNLSKETEKELRLKQQLNQETFKRNFKKRLD